MMNQTIRISLALLFCFCFRSVGALKTSDNLRPPAVPLVAHDPYLSIWSRADRLTDDGTRHWTGAKHSLVSLIRIDKETYRIMGDTPSDVPPMRQTYLKVLPTRTIYKFQSPELFLTLTFTTPALPDDLKILARPLTYITWSARSADGKPHRVAVFMSASSELAVNDPSQTVTWKRAKAGTIDCIMIGTVEQPVLERAGDDTRIDWGYAYLAAGNGENLRTVAAQDDCETTFAITGKLPVWDSRMPRAVKNHTPAMAVVMQMAVPKTGTRSRFAMLAYDDIYSILYFNSRLRGYWHKNGMEMSGLLIAASREYDKLTVRCVKFDNEMMADLTKAGGSRYAQVCALAYRQSLAACKLVADAKGQPMLFPKENTSNGCIATVDVIYPMDPMYLFISPMLAKASLAPVLNYTASSLWKFRYAPHDLGTYPLATRQIYGSDDPAHEGDRMPVEESGNMILLIAAVAKIEGNAEFASQYWPQITKWAKYLEEKGFDPANQLCTDDFTGHLAHNANLSVKAIEALAAYGYLCDLRGDGANGAKYRKLAKSMATQWARAANDGDHYRIAFDKPGTWSQKYNMVWDSILSLNAFDASVSRKEVAFYLKTADRFGLALDYRQPYAKIDWLMWTASLRESQQDFLALTDPIYDFLNTTPDRNPMTDLYWTKTGREVGMHARPVVGGLFIKMLTVPSLWKKWALRTPNTNARWAAIPPQPKTRQLVPTSEKTPIKWRYTTEMPDASWFKAGYEYGEWLEGYAGFGAKGTPGAVVRTEWTTPDIWMSREFTMPAKHGKNLVIRAYRDEDIEVYINGVLACTAGGFTTEYKTYPIRPAAIAALRPSKNTIAIHCHQTEGGQGVDAGISEIVK